MHPVPTTPCGVLELRQYTLHPGKRDSLIELFEREFVDTQESVGITLPGLFRDLDDEDRFVWLRGFPDMPTRAASLGAFYGGPAWQAHRDAANAMMIDSDNVLLLRPVGAATQPVSMPPAEPASHDGIRGVVVATTYHFASTVDASRFVRFFADEINPILADVGARVLGTCSSEHAANTFPKLPIREGENVFVWLAAFPDVDAYARCTSELHSALRTAVGGELAVVQEEVLRLSPTSRSRLPASQGGQ